MFNKLKLFCIFVFLACSVIAIISAGAILGLILSIIIVIAGPLFLLCFFWFIFKDFSDK